MEGIFLIKCPCAHSCLKAKCLCTHSLEFPITPSPSFPVSPRQPFSFLLTSSFGICLYFFRLSLCLYCYFLIFSFKHVWPSQHGARFSSVSSLSAPDVSLLSILNTYTNLSKLLKSHSLSICYYDSSNAYLVKVIYDGSFPAGSLDVWFAGEQAAKAGTCKHARMRWVLRV